MRYAWMTMALAFATGCGANAPVPPAAAPAPAKAKVAHDHPDEGPHGGPLADWGDEEFHVEFTVDRLKKETTVYILDGSAKKAVPIAAKELTLALDVTPRVTFALAAKPQDGDPAGQSSRFVGSHEALGGKKEFSGTISAKVGGKPYSGEFEEKPHALKADASPERGRRDADLFLKPGGIYTQADIAKNGNVVPSVKFRDLAFDHDDNLKTGDRICPVTVNKADEKCNWWINGKEYQFCCPPCLDKFVRLAKDSPEKIKDPGEYIKK